MTEDGFKNWMDGFWAWTSKGDRKLSSWLYSLMEWSGQEYHRAHKKEKES